MRTVSTLKTVSAKALQFAVTHFTMSPFTYLLCLTCMASCHSDKLKATRVPGNKQHPVPRGGPQFDPEKLSATKALSEADPKSRQFVDFMRLKHWGQPQHKELLLTYSGRWSLHALVESQEFALFIPHRSAKALGYECDADDKRLHRVNAFSGGMMHLEVELNGQDAPMMLYALMGCNAAQMKHAMLWGTYDSIPLSSVVLSAQQSPRFDRLETDKQSGSRYAKTKRRIIERYGAKGSGFWAFAEHSKLIGQRPVEKPYAQNGEQEKSEL